MKAQSFLAVLFASLLLFNTGGNEGGKHSFWNSFQAYNVVPRIVELVVSMKPPITRNHCGKPIPHTRRYCREVERDGDDRSQRP